MKSSIRRCECGYETVILNCNLEERKHKYCGGLLKVIGETK